MDNLLSGLDKFGLDLNKINSVAEQNEKNDKPKTEVKKEAEFNEADIVFDKTMECTVCGKSFKTKVVRAGKARLVYSDTDLKPVYQGFEPLKYDVIVCEHCGYAATTRSFGHVTPGQIKLIREVIGASFSGIAHDEKIYTFNDAIERYKLALANAMVMRGKTSEKAYLCLKLAWLYRSMYQGIPESNDVMIKLRNGFIEEEKKYIQSAYEGFTESYSTENPPICGMDENTITYLLADLARRCGDMDNCKKFLSTVLTSRNATSKLKDRARDLKELILQE